MNDRNPLTGLPGNNSIKEILTGKVIEGGWTAVYVDIVNFKPFNDHYGFALGDSVIRRLGLILTESMRDCFTGHIGGDDFICAGPDRELRRYAQEARQRFRSIAQGFYSERDRAQGGIETFDRRGSYRFFPMLDVSMVFVSGTVDHSTVEQISMEASRGKSMLKGEQLAEPVFPVLERVMDGKASPKTSSADLKALIEACGVLREEDAVPVLNRIITGKYSWNIRKSAALALGHIGNRRCSEILLDALADPNPHVRTRSVQGLVLAMGSKSGPVIHPLVKDSSTWVRRAVLNGIGRAGWINGTDSLLEAATVVAPGKMINTREERRAALQGLAMLGSGGTAPFLYRLCELSDFYPKEAAYNALFSVGTDLAARIVLKELNSLPAVLNLYGISQENLEALEKLAVKTLEGDDSGAANAIRFFEGFPGSLGRNSISSLKNCLGRFYGEMFRRTVLILERRELPADPSCIARVSARISKGHRIGDEALCTFLRWVSRMGGAGPGALLNSFLRTEKRSVAATAALAAGSLARKGLDATL